MSDNTVTVSRSDPYSLDWVILKVLNTDETLFLKNAIQNLITKLNIQRTTYNNITGINCEQFDLFNHINDTSYGMPILKKIIAVVNDALVASKITKNVNNVSAVWTINGYENAFHEIHSHTPRNTLFNKSSLTIPRFSPCIYFALLPSLKNKNLFFWVLRLSINIEFGIERRRKSSTVLK